VRKVKKLVRVASSISTIGGEQLALLFPWRYAMKIRLLGLIVASLLLAADDTKEADEAAKQIEGAWQGVSLEQDGNKNDDADKFTVKIKDGKYEVKRGDETTGKGKLKLDPTKNPHAMDIMIEEGAGSGETELGIYEVKDSMLKTCFAKPDKPRPTQFSAKEGSGNTLIVLKRRKS
jgi:uncharacterized protein (TIGR03067 family)